LLPPAPSQFNWQDGLVYAYYAGAAIFLLVLLFKLVQLARIARRGKTDESAGYKVVYLDEPETAFSFFKYLFISTSPKSAETIIRHELVHIRQRHSADILFIELLKVINWFNPFIYLLQRSLRAVHEYIADEQTASAGSGALAYSSFLVDNAYGLSGASVTHSFFNYNLLKKRIIMLHQKRSGKLARLKYLLTVPVCAGLLCVSTLAFSKTYGWVNIGPQKVADTIRQVRHRHSIDNINYNYTYTTSKGYKVKESITSNGGDTIKTVIVFDKNDEYHVYDDKTISANDRKTLLDKYGYKFPSGKILTIRLLPPPPPPVPPMGDHNPPPPPAPPTTRIDLHRPGHITKKGYRYTESGYIVDDKSDFRVIITEKNGDQKEFWKSSATAADIKLLRDKYGYTFPTMPLYSKLPPPPPAPPTVKELAPPPPPTPPVPLKEIPPPPPAPPVDDQKAPPPPPAPPAPPKEISLDNLPDKVKLNGIEISKKRPKGYVADHPLIIVNGTKYYTSGTASVGQHLQLSATDSTVVYKDFAHAIAKYGEDGKEGVMELYGRISVAMVTTTLTDKQN
jgi:hypothetical protein